MGNSSLGSQRAGRTAVSQLLIELDGVSAGSPTPAPPWSGDGYEVTIYATPRVHRAWPCGCERKPHGLDAARQLQERRCRGRYESHVPGVSPSFTIVRLLARTAGTALTRLVPYGGPFLYCYSKGMARISTKNQITIPVAALEEVGLHAGERVTVEPAGDGELRIRRTTTTFEDAFGTLTGTYPAGYLAQLDAEDELR
jgi:AbrB family looped-hinge helix DNA binding protein